MTTGDRHIGSDSQHRLSDQVSANTFQTTFGPHAEAIMADIPNYTDIQPTIQFSEVKI